MRDLGLGPRGGKPTAVRTRIHNKNQLSGVGRGCSENTTGKDDIAEDSWPAERALATAAGAGSSSYPPGRRQSPHPRPPERTSSNRRSDGREKCHDDRQAGNCIGRKLRVFSVRLLKQV